MSKKVAIIHTTPVTIDVLKSIMNEEYPKVEIINILDDSMLPEINKAGEITKDVRYRLYNYITSIYKTQSVDVILSACSSIGKVFTDAQNLVDCPLIRIDYEMARQAVNSSNRICVAATLKSTLNSTSDLLREIASKNKKQIEIDFCLIEGAGKLLINGDMENYKKLISQELIKNASQSQKIVLAQASMAQAIDYMPDTLSSKCLTSTQSGVQSLRKYLEV